MLGLHEFIAAFWLLQSLWSGVSGAPAPVNSIKMKVVNQAGAPIELFWVDAYSRKAKDGLIKQTTKPIRNNTDTTINSYDTHSFVAKFLKPVDGVDEQPQVKFVKGPREETVLVSYDEKTNTMSAKQTTKFNEIMDTVSSATKTCSDLPGDGFSSCIATAIMDDIATITDAKVQLTKYRDLIAYRLRNYTCADPTMNSSVPERSYNHVIDDKSYTFDVLLDTDHAKIWTIDDFVTAEECAVLERHGRPRLRSATVAAEDGTSIVSENRKAQQAHYNLRAYDHSEPLWPLYSRVLTATNHHTGFRIQPVGEGYCGPQ